MGNWSGKGQSISFLRCSDDEYGSKGETKKMAGGTLRGGDEGKKIVLPGRYPYLCHNPTESGSRLEGISRVRKKRGQDTSEYLARTTILC